MPALLQVLDVLPEQAVERFVPVNDNAPCLAQRPDVLDDKGVQPVEPGFEFVPIDSVTYRLRDNLEVALVPDRDKRVKLLGRIVLKQARHRPLALLAECRIVIAADGRT